MDRSGVQSGSGVWGPAWEGCEISPQIGGLPFQSRQHRVVGGALRRAAYVEMHMCRTQGGPG